MRTKYGTAIVAIFVLLAAAIACGPTTAQTEVAPVEDAAEAPAEESAPQKSGDMPVLEDSEATIRIIKSGSSTTLYALKNETASDDTLKPGVVRYTVEMPPDTQVDLGPGWCTKTEADRTDNKKHFDPTLTVNGQVIPDSKLEYFEWETDEGAFCFSWDIVASDWPVGEHKVSEAFTFDESVNDGWGEYPAGDYATEYAVTVSEGASLPSAAPVEPAAPEDTCIPWDAVTIAMKGETVCMRGLITKFSVPGGGGTRYSFSDKSGTFFLYSAKYEITNPNTGKTIAPGTCVEVTGTIEVQSDVPFINLDKIIEHVGEEIDGFTFYADPAACD